MSMDIATLSKIHDLLVKTGNSTDAAGINTLFAQLNQIRAYTDTIETLLGLTGDAASGTGSVMARLAQIVNYVDTVETTVNAINAKPAGVAVDKSMCMPFMGKGLINLTTTYQTLYSYTGKGYLDLAILEQNSVNTDYVTIKITIDGAVMFEGSAGGFDSATVNNPKTWGGIILRDLLGFMYNGTTNLQTIKSASGLVGSQGGAAGFIYTLPYTDNTQVANQVTRVTIPDSLYFDTSILIQAKGNATNANYNNIGYSYQGGKI